MPLLMLSTLIVVLQDVWFKGIMGFLCRLMVIMSQLYPRPEVNGAVCDGLGPTQNGGVWRVMIRERLAHLPLG